MPGHPWLRSTYCAAGECVEVAEAESMIQLRTSTAPDTVIQITAAEWRAFLLGMRYGDFDNIGTQ
jgi:Domain of unknown function (DUF397)